MGSNKIRTGSDSDRVEHSAGLGIATHIHFSLCPKSSLFSSKSTARVGLISGVTAFRWVVLSTRNCRALSLQRWDGLLAP